MPPPIPPAPVQTQSREDATLYVGRELRGYRAWTPDWDGDTPILRPISRARAVPWQPGVNVAQCYRDGEFNDAHPLAHADGTGAPAEKCSCGFYGLYNPQHHAFNDTLVCGQYTPYLVTGTVQAEGVIRLWTEGYRSEKATITALSPPKYIDSDTYLALNGIPQWHTHYTQSYRHYGAMCTCVTCVRGKRTPPTLDQLAKRYGVPFYQTFDEMTKVLPPTETVHRAPISYGYGFSSGIITSVMITQAMTLTMSNMTQYFNTIMAAKQVPSPTITDAAFAGNSVEVVQKWWRWNLTGKIT